MNLERPQLVVVPPALAARLSPGHRAAVYAVVFLMTAAAAMWATSLPPFGGFLMGLGWMLVLEQISKWVDSLDGR